MICIQNVISVSGCYVYKSNSLRQTLHGVKSDVGVISETYVVRNSCVNSMAEGHTSPSEEPRQAAIARGIHMIPLPANLNVRGTVTTRVEGTKNSNVAHVHSIQSA